MKKLFALALVLIMALSVTALAETPTIEMVDWETLAATEGMDAYVTNGQFYGLEAIGLKVWIPNGLQQVESEYTPYLFSDEEGVSALSVFIEDAPEGLDPTDPDALYAYVRDVVSGDDVTPSVVNGIYCVTYTLGDEDLLQFCMTYGAADGHLIHFIVDGVDRSDADEMAALLLMMGSVMAI